MGREALRRRDLYQSPSHLHHPSCFWLRHRSDATLIAYTHGRRATNVDSAKAWPAWLIRDRFNHSRHIYRPIGPLTAELIKP
jgi:hypothetical protein